MADIMTLFDKIVSGSVTFSGTETWVDMFDFFPDKASPIPVGKRIWVGFITCIAYDKEGKFEYRPNLPGKSDGNLIDTQIRGFSKVPAGDSDMMDLYYNNAVTTLAPVSANSTGVEKAWLKIKSSSSAAATFDFIGYYTIY